MAYYNQIQIANAPGEPGTPVAAISPLYEVTSPQYPHPNAYQLANVGYRRNEVVFACIQKRAAAVAEAPIALYRGNTEKPLNAHPVLDLLKQPNEAMGQVEFWQAVQIYLDIAGFSVWEKEYNRIGQVMHLWPMRPDWCSFMRGDARPLQYVRYQPYGGIPYVDVPIERCVVFMEFDPLYPMLKGLSRTMIATRATGVDNAATDFLKLFFEHGAQSNGILKTKQSLERAEALRMKALWREQHGGYENWQDITVMGSDVDYVATQMNFKDMDFTNIDGRDETRICQVFDVPPILIGARIGLDRATYSNYQQAREAWYQESISARWRWLESEVTQQLVCAPEFEGPESDTAARFNTQNVRALQEDRDAKWTRAVAAAQANMVTRDEARKEAGLEPIDNDDVFIGVTVRATSTTTDATAVGGQSEDPGVAAGLIAGQPLAGHRAPGQPSPAAQFNGLVAQQQQHAALRKQALANVGKAIGAPFDDELAACKTAKETRDVFERHYPTKAQVAPTDAELLAALKTFNELAEQP
jgi:HK97 family phage portal protein